MRETLQLWFTIWPPSQVDGDQFLLFQAYGDRILNPDHPLIVLT